MLRICLFLLLATSVSSDVTAEWLFTEDFRSPHHAWTEDKSARVTWSEDGLAIRGSRGLRLAGDSSALSRDLIDSGAITVSAWFVPANLDQEGPARIFTLSKNSSERNFTIGQEKNRIEVRIRTTGNGKNGTPGLVSRNGSLRKELTHVVCTFDEQGSLVLYLDGQESARRSVPGDFSNWDPDFALAVGDELSGGRPWEGRIVSVAVSHRALTADEVSRLFDAGPGGGVGSSKEKEDSPAERNEQLFETEITTILTRHCLECHDSATAEGGLDLSKKLASHVEDGILVAGNPADSLLWEVIDSGEMPPDRPALSDEEKKRVHEWIEGGANWSVAFVDPAIYSRPAMAAPSWTRRLTKGEYIATVRDTFGIDLADEAGEILPDDVRADGFDNTAYNLTVDLAHIEAYAHLADQVGNALDVAEFAKRFSRKRDLTDKTMIALIEEMGEWILRGPLDGDEKALYRGVSTSVASAGGSFDDAVRLVIVAMCQSPRFLYRVEKPPRGSRPRPVDSYELASRLSYFIWGSSPDRTLLGHARSGSLHSPGTIRSEVERMLDDPRARDQSLAFFSQWLHLDRLDHLTPSTEHFPDWDPELADWMKEETLSFIDEVVWNQRAPLSALLDADVTFLNAPLARHYGIEADVPEKELARVSLEEVRSRGGLLTQGGTLTVGGDEASMVSRGLFVLHDLLRGVVRDPPPGVDLTPQPSQAGLTQRGIAIERIADKSCGGCHEKFEPLAFGLERFDGLGTYREKDRFGNELREDGEVLIPGEAEARPYANVAELMELLAASDRVRETITWKLVQFALGRPLDARDATAVASIHAEAWNAGGRYADLVTAFATSDLNRYAASGPEPDPASVPASSQASLTHP